ncbi:amidophosphoribosyltransferase [Marimonas arenosa]|uniref:amidophosphoribosyltransferase n=1 Tax=Marimonas arenosa TaxID=1795305 RepID=UPI0027D206EF|nr:amidophosphoribosyltransferase [Marimonas arenosa]
MAHPDPTAPGLDQAARLATVTARFDTDGLILLGTFGSESRPGAILRLPDGDTRRVTTGDTVGDMTVQAISDGKVVIETSGRVSTLVSPGDADRPRRGMPHHGQGR